jgi:hypothetical protein
MMQTEDIRISFFLHLLNGWQELQMSNVKLSSISRVKEGRKEEHFFKEIKETLWLANVEHLFLITCFYQLWGSKHLTSKTSRLRQKKYGIHSWIDEISWKNHSHGRSGGKPWPQLNQVIILVTGQRRQSCQTWLIFITSLYSSCAFHQV